jgi:hypothetical protein
MGYNAQIKQGVINNSTKTAIGIICFAIPPVLIAISLIIFSTKFKIHGELKQQIHDLHFRKKSRNKPIKNKKRTLQIQGSFFSGVIFGSLRSDFCGRMISAPTINLFKKVS